MTITRWFIGCCGIALLSGCSIFSKGPAPSYYLLTAHATDKTVSSKTTALDTTIGVGPVRVAPFLERVNITTHAGGGDLQFSDNQRWGEPLEQGIQRILLQNIHTMTGAEMRNFPWRQTAIPHYAARIDIADLDRLADGQATLDVRWQLEDLTTARVIKSATEHFSVAVKGTDNSALASAYSELFAQLAAKIAQTIPQQ